jgi:hypothetical protein
MRKQFLFKHSFKWHGSGYTKIYEIGGVAEKTNKSRRRLNLGYM